MKPVNSSRSSFNANEFMKNLWKICGIVITYEPVVVLSSLIVGNGGIPYCDLLIPHYHFENELPVLLTSQHNCCFFILSSSSRVLKFHKVLCLSKSLSKSLPVFRT